jgi:hypothetical protein
LRERRSHGKKESGHAFVPRGCVFDEEVVQMLSTIQSSRGVRWSSCPVLALALLGLLLLPAPGRGADAEAEQVTMKGEIVDLACYLPRGEKGRGPSHEECAEMCAKGGAPLGLLGDDGTVLLLVEDHQKAAAYTQVKELAGKRAEVAGKRFSRGGISGLVVTTASGL